MMVEKKKNVSSKKTAIISLQKSTAGAKKNMAQFRNGINYTRFMMIKQLPKICVFVYSFQPNQWFEESMCSVHIYAIEKDLN